MSTVSEASLGRIKDTKKMSNGLVLNRSHDTYHNTLLQGHSLLLLGRFGLRRVS